MRVRYFLEACDNIREADKHDLQAPEKWANLLCAIGNATIAAMPDSVVAGVEAEMLHRQSVARRTQKKAQKKVRDDLRGK